MEVAFALDLRSLPSNWLHKCGVYHSPSLIAYLTCPDGQAQS